MIVNKSMLTMADMLEKKQIKSVEIANSYIERIQRLNPEINAYITFEADKLIDAAMESDERRAKGDAMSVFDGIPIAIKDNISTKGVRTTCGSKILENYIPPYDAGSYEKLKSKGFLLLGKTNMDEFAMGSTNETSYFGPVKNPHDFERVPGGSSGGSAAAVAAKMAPAALGSDTGGSIRQPAAFCGTVGIKPTYGKVSRYGLAAFASSLDQIGTFASSVDDAAALLEAISGYDNRDSTSIKSKNDFAPEYLSGDIKGLKIGISEEYFNGANEETRKVIEDTIDKLKKEGAEVVDVSLKMNKYAVPVYYLIATAEASSNLGRYDGVKYGYRSPNVEKLSDLYINTRSEGFGAEVKRRIMLGTFSLSSGYYDAYYLKAMKCRTLIINDFKEAFQKCDVIMTPVAPTTAFRIGAKVDDPLEMYLGDILTISANLAAIPGVSVPAGTDSSNLPVGLQILGPHFSEKIILNAAKAVEAVSEDVEATL